MTKYILINFLLLLLVLFQFLEQMPHFITIASIAFPLLIVVLTALYNDKNSKNLIKGATLAFAYAIISLKMHYIFRSSMWPVLFYATNISLVYASMLTVIYYKFDKINILYVVSSLLSFLPIVVSIFTQEIDCLIFFMYQSLIINLLGFVLLLRIYSINKNHSLSSSKGGL